MGVSTNTKFKGNQDPRRGPYGALKDYRKVNLKGHPVSAALQHILSLLSPTCYSTGETPEPAIRLALRPEMGRKAHNNQTGRERFSSRNVYTDPGGQGGCSDKSFLLARLKKEQHLMGSRLALSLSLCGQSPRCRSQAAKEPLLRSG